MLNRAFFSSVCRMRNTTYSQHRLDQRELFLSPSFSPTILHFFAGCEPLMEVIDGFFASGETAHWVSERPGFLLGSVSLALCKRKEQAKTVMPFKLGCRNWKWGLQEINQRKLSRIGTNGIELNKCWGGDACYVVSYLEHKSLLIEGGKAAPLQTLCGSEDSSHCAQNLGLTAPFNNGGLDPWDLFFLSLSSHPIDWKEIALFMEPHQSIRCGGYRYWINH